MTREVLPGIQWVGYTDWSVRDFHGYRSESGSTYNSYLILDELPTLIDTVKAPYSNVLLDNVARHVELSKIRYVVCNHAEPDHSGGMVRVMEALPNAEVVCDVKCQDALARHYEVAKWKFRVVKDGDTLSLGRRTLQFLEPPMVHWPESMFTYVQEDRLLFSMDAFGQHLASSGCFDDEVPADVLMAEAKTYYANIIMLYGRQVAAVLDRAAKIPIDIIAPSHGVIWRKNLGMILDAYRNWVVQKPAKKVLVVFDTMWGSTDKMARAIADGVMETGADVKLLNVRASNLTVIATEVLDAAAVAFGSPTLNGTLMPEVAAVLAYLKGLRPAGKAGFAFGSYGWGKGGPDEIDGILKIMKFEILREPLQSRFSPAVSVIEECRAGGRLLGEAAKRIAGT